MPRVQSSIKSLLQAQVKQDDGFVPQLQVDCPSSEPRREGTVFSCAISVSNNGDLFTTQVHETDSHGDFLVEDLQQVRAAHGAPSPSPVPATTPTTTPTTTPAPPPTQPAALTGPPTNGQVALISVDASDQHLTLETQGQDVNYAACPQFGAVTPSGTSVAFSGLAAGEFATVQIDGSCVRQLSLVNPPVPPQCTTSGLPGSAVVTWEGFNESAHSVLYLPSGPKESIVAGRWCSAPTVVGANDAAISLSQIPKGAQVQILMATDDEWITRVTVKS
jgi:hypothetical protein